MSQSQDAIERAFLNPDGTPTNITNIEFERVGDGWRYNLWSEGRRLLCFPVAGHVAELLETTYVLVDPARADHPKHAGRG